MDVPLAAHRVIVEGEQHLDVWADGERRRVDPPFLPYCYARGRLPVDAVHEERVTVRPLSTLEPETWTRLSFPTVQGVADANRFEGDRAMAENHVAFVERILVDEPDWFRRWPNTHPLRLLHLDVEQLTTGEGFPTERDPLVSIGWRGEVLGEDVGETEVVLGDGEDDEGILRAFTDAVRRFDPDVLVGYNHVGYDLPMIAKRMRANDLDTSALARTREAPTIPDDASPGPWGENVHLDGRLVYDVLRSVRADQTLYGIKDRKLKTVGRWMGLDVVEEDTSNTSKLVGTDRLRRYNASDVDLTRDLAHVYLRNFLELAELYGAPLNVVLRATSSFHTRMLQGRVLKRLGIVSDGRNDERYRDLYASGQGGKAFVGGLVDIYQRGLFRPVWHVDFSSMYPSIMVSLGCGADNTRHLGTEPMGPFQVEVDEGRRVYHVPDEHRDLRHLVEVTGESPMARELGSLLAHRLELKRRVREASDPEERARLHARQNVIKVVLNSVYGVMASRHARYGSLPVAIATVGVARQLVRRVEDHLGEAKVETDTDGVYSSRPVDAAAVTKEVARYMEDELGGRPHLRLEVDRYEAGWFHEAKNYLLLHEDGRLEKHGVAFKGSSHCGVHDEALDRVSRALLSGEEDPRTVAQEVLDLDRYDPEDFVMRIRLGKDPDDYASENHLAPQVARAARRHLDLDPKRGDQLEYVKARWGYDVARPRALANLDEAYYRDLVVKILDRLGVPHRPTEQQSLREWFH